MLRSILAQTRKQKINTYGRFLRFYSIPNIPLFKSALNPQNAKKTAIVSRNNHYTYSQLLHDSKEIANLINVTKGSKVSFLFDPGYEYVATQWAIWRSLAVAVPLCNTHPLTELEYFIEQSKSTQVIYHERFEEFLKPLKEKFSNVKFIKIPSIEVQHNLQPQEYEVSPVNLDTDAMIIYTSGTTARPKGVLSTHRAINASITSLVDAWKWNENDYILHCLPLHHVHGIINILSCALYSGATCEFIKFDPGLLWKRFTDGDVTLFMAVPTIYSKLIKYFEEQPPNVQEKLKNNLKSFRLMVSGSAPLPDNVFNKWKEITGFTLLERYGMTEIGMALSNPYDGERKIGHVGKPLPNVEVKVVDEKTGKEVDPKKESGELWVKGPQLFKEYFDNPKATQESRHEGWFKTGDIVECDEEGSFRILGRSSVDIIKYGGYKISALEVERILQSHPRIVECAVVGVPDEEYGQKIGALVVLKEGTMTIEELKEWCRDKIAYYKIPSHLLIVDQIEKNAMGKMNKKQLVKLFK